MNQAILNMVAIHANTADPLVDRYGPWNMEYRLDVKNDASET